MESTIFGEPISEEGLLKESAASHFLQWESATRPHLHQASYPRSEHSQTRLTCLLPGQDRSGDDWGQHQRIQKWIDSGGRKLVHGWICLDCKKILVKYTWSKVLKEMQTYQNLKRRLVFSLIQSVERIDNKSFIWATTRTSWLVKLQFCRWQWRWPWPLWPSICLLPYS